MKCPQCETDTVRRQEYEGIAANQCGGCGGFWMKDEELRLVLETADLNIFKLSPDERAIALGRGPLDYGWGNQIACADCESPLEEFRFLVSSRIYVDYCPQGHGMWLEPGKLERLQLVLREEFKHRIPSRSPELSLAAAGVNAGELIEVSLDQLSPDLSPTI